MTTIVVASLIVIAFAGVYYFARVRGATRYDAFAKLPNRKASEDVRTLLVYALCRAEGTVWGIVQVRDLYRVWNQGIERRRTNLQGGRRQELSDVAVSRWIEERRYTAVANLSEQTGCSLP